MAQRKTRADQIHRGKTPTRRHFLPEWAVARGLSQADISRELEVEKSTVSRWFGGVIPDDRNLDRLVGLLHIEVLDLFRHPDEDWLAKFFRGRDEKERERIKATLETAFPRRSGTEG
jgi:transcriptional regulator with XRE-family HTH domain